MSTLIYKIVNLLDTVDDITNDYIDKIEIEPTYFGGNLYISGFERSPLNYTDVKAHIKQIRKINLKSLNSTITMNGGELMMEPDGEVMMDCNLLDEDMLEMTFDKFKENFEKLNSFHIMHVTYREKDGDNKKSKTYMYESKKVACKEALAMRKIYKDVSVKFTTFQADTEKGGFNLIQREKTDFEIATAAVTV